MVMMISLVQETRGTSMGAGNAKAPVLFQGFAEDYNNDLSFGFSGDGAEPASTAQVKFRMPFPQAQNVIPISQRPQRPVYYWQRARYAQIHDGPLRMRTWLIEGALIEQIGAQMASVTLNLKSPEAWVSKYPSRNGTDGKDLTGTRSQIIERLTLSVSNQVPEDGEPFKMLPIIPFNPNWTPNAAQVALGYVKGADVDDGTIITVPSPDPLSITEALTTAMAGWGAGFGTYGLTVIEEYDYDGEAPFWRWVLWKRRVSERMLTWEEMALYDIEASNEFTDAMVYNSDNPQEHRYLGGSTIANSEHNGAWLGVSFESYTKQDPNGVLPQPPTPPTVDYTGGPDWTGGGNWGGGDQGSWTNPGMGGNTVFPTPDGGFITPGGDYVEPETDPRNVTLLVNLPVSGALPVQQLQVPVRAGMPFVNNVSGPVEQAFMKWAVYVDGNFQQNFTETAWVAGGRDLLVPIPNDGEDHVVEIRPQDGVYSKGWACRIGFQARPVLPQPWLKMILAMGSGAYTAPSGKTMPHRFQWSRCINLVSVADPDKDVDFSEFPMSVRWREKRWQECQSLQLPPADGVDWSNFAFPIPSNWREAEFTGCTQLRESPIIKPMPKVTAIAGYLLNGWLYGCESVRIGPLPLWSEVTSLGENAFEAMLMGVKNATLHPSFRNIFPKLTQVGYLFMMNLAGGIESESFSYVTHCYLPFLPSATFSGYGFMQGVYSFISRAPDGKPAKIDDQPLNQMSVGGVGGYMSGAFQSNLAINETMVECGLQVAAKGYMAGAYRDTQIEIYNPDVMRQPVSTSSWVNYKQQCYYNSWAGEGTPELRIIDKATATAMGSNQSQLANNMRNAFGSNGYDGSAGARILYTDGTPVVGGSNRVSPAFYSSI